MPATIVLRFRDLAGDTIPEHQVLIKEFGYCWWGWWNKPNERTPRDVMAALHGLIQKEGGLTVFLIDSGSVTLYRARIIDIFVSATERLEPCPEPEKTPEYYRKRSWKMWFKIERIESIEDGLQEIRNWSYDEVPELIDDPLSNEYQDKRVFSLEEMLNRKHRTIYFLKPTEQTHRDQELTPALPTYVTTPFVDHPFVAKSNYIIHLSDLHFGTSEDGESTHEFALVPEAHAQTLVQLISVDIDRLYPDTPPAAVILSGDFSWRGLAKEFALAKEFIRSLRSMYDLDLHQIIIIPGNHDITWSDDPGNHDPKDKVNRPPDQAEANYRDFFREIYGITSDEYMSMGRRLILSNYVPIDFVAFNSCRLEQKHFGGFGFVSAEQVTHGLAQMGWTREPRGNKYRVAIMHHHLLSVSPQEEIDKFGRVYSLSLDAGQITYELLKADVDLVLHGHVHQPFAAVLGKRPHAEDFPPGRQLAIHATGSAGVRRQYTGAIGRNAFSVIRFEPDHFDVAVRVLSENRVGFEEHWKSRFQRQGELGSHLIPLPYMPTNRVQPRAPVARPR